MKVTVWRTHQIRKLTPVLSNLSTKRNAHSKTSKNLDETQSCVATRSEDETGSNSEVTFLKGSVSPINLQDLYGRWIDGVVFGK